MSATKQPSQDEAAAVRAGPRSLPPLQLSWLYTLHRDPTSDGYIARTWEPKHQQRLALFLKGVDPQDHRKVDEVFEAYARMEGLLSKDFLKARAQRIKRENRYFGQPGTPGRGVAHIAKLLTQARDVLLNDTEAPAPRSMSQRIRTALHAARSALHL